MFGGERLQAIRKMLREKESVEVAALSKMLDVSEMTIRRDLDKLEKEGVAIKTYGGAILKKNNNNLEDNIVNKNNNIIKIAKMASELIEDGEVIFIGGSKISIEICNFLDEKNGIVVVTNNIFVASKVLKHSKNKVIITAGEINPNTGDIYGFETNQSLSSFLVEKAFISVDGIDSELGYTTNNKEYINIYKIIKKISNRIILIAESKQYCKRGLIRVANLEEIKEVITDKKIPNEFKEFYFNNDIKLYASMVDN